MSVLSDLRYALRQLWKSPGFAIAAVLSLALGIAATVAVFSVIYGVLINPYPYKAADRIVNILTEDKGGNLNRVLLTGSQFEQIGQAKSVENAVAWQNWDLPLTGSGLPEDVRAEFLTANASAYFGVPPLLGRGLLPSDSPPSGDAQTVAVLNYSFWRRHFDANPRVVGKTLQLLHKNYTVVGVLPPRFTWNNADVYLPLKIGYGPNSVLGFSVRLRPGVSLQAADAEFQGLFEQFAGENPARFPKVFRVRGQRLNDRYGKSLEHTLYLLFASVALLLLIGCANVSILLLARGASRQHELAVRAAIGASRARVIRQLLTESLALSLSGTSLGILLAYWLVTQIVKWLPYFSYPHEAAIRINLPVLIFSVGVALVASILFGLSPALQLSQSDLGQVMQSATRRIMGGIRGRRAHAALIAGQIALTLVLLAAAGGAAEAFLRLMHTNLGYDPHNTMDVGIPMHPGTYATWSARAAYFDQLRSKVAALPGVVSVSNSSDATPPVSGTNERVKIMGQSAQEYNEARLNLAGAEYFSLLRIPLKQGRVWNQAETMRGAHLAAINETMAQRYWPHGDAIGHAIRMPQLKEDPPLRFAAPGSDQWFQIIGIVGDVSNDGLLEPVKPAVYLPYTIWLGVEPDLLVRTRTAPLSVLHAVRAQIQSVDSNQEVDQIVPTLEQLIAMQPEWQRGRLMTMLVGSFGLLALALATFGLYSVVSYSVARRTSEFGIRMALGARQSDVLWTVLLSTAAPVASGLLAGLALAAVLNQVLAHWIEPGSRDPFMLLAAALVLASASALAGFLPSRRASKIDPIEALRYE